MPGFHGGRPNGAVDWLDACNERRLSSLVDLDDESATLDYRWRASPCADFRIGSVLATQLVHADRGLRGRCIVPKRSCCRLKFVMNEMGLLEENLRLPLVAVTANAREKLKAAMKASGI